MRPIAALLLVLLCAPSAHADKESPYKLRLDVDLPLIILGGVLWGGTSFIGGTGGPYCGSDPTMPCDTKELNALDRAAVFYDPTLRTVATAVGSVPFAFVLLPFFDAGPKNWRSWGSDLVVIVEALAWDGAVQDIVRRAVRRPRPYLYLPDVDPYERVGSEAAFSFYSGHTSFAFTLATSVAYGFELRHPHSKWRYLVWPGLLALASIEPVLRVLSGDHFPTDVIVGALAGSAFGVLLPALHRKTGVTAGAVVTADRAVLTLSWQR